MKIIKIITNPYTLIISFLIIIISGEHLGNFYFTYLLLALPHFGIYSILALIGIVFMLITFHSKKTNASLINPILNIAAVLLLLASIFTFYYIYEGDKVLQASFGLEYNQPKLFANLKSFYTKGTLVIHNGEAGSIGSPDIDFKQATFQPFLSGQKEKGFYEQYITIRDSYIDLSQKETSGNVEYAGLRKLLQDSYEKFIDQYGLLNYPANRKLITNDTAFGFTILSSLERKEGEKQL